MADCGNICELARRHDLRPSQLFTWRRELRYAGELAQGSIQSAPEPMFVPTVIASEPAGRWCIARRESWTRGYHERFGLVHVEYATFERTPKPSAHWLGGVSRAGMI